MYEEHLQLNTKKIYKPIKNGQRIWTETSSDMRYDGKYVCEQMLNIISHLGNEN